ncbi:hypothetical protein DMENIID0001_133660 [Sergentomyia squamirostris]
MATLVNFPQSTHREVVGFMTSLAEMVIRETPGDFYTFAQKYFEDLLLKRDGKDDREYEKLNLCAKFIKDSFEGGTTMRKIDEAKKRRIDFLKIYKKVSLEKKIQQGSNQDDNRLTIPTMEEKVLKFPEKEQEDKLKLYKDIAEKFDPIFEIEELGIVQEALENPCDQVLDIVPKGKSDILIVNQLIQIYLPNCFTSSLQDILPERSVEEVELIPYRNSPEYSVKFSILAWNDYGVVLSVDCGHDAEVIFFLLKMPDDQTDILEEKSSLKALEFEKELPKFEVDSETFKGFLMKFLDSFYPRGDYHQFTLIKVDDVPQVPALEGSDQNLQEANPTDQFSSFEKTMELYRLENDTGFIKTHHILRPKTAPSATVKNIPKHLRQRVKSANQ